MHDDRYGCPWTVDIEQCTNCEHFFCWPPLGPDEIASLYEEYYGRSSVNPDEVASEARRNVLLPRWRRWIRGATTSGQYFAPSGSNVLDIGSGTCQDALEAQLLGHRVDGFDVDTGSVRLGESIGVSIRSGSDVVAAFEGRRFDWIQLNQVVEHYIDPIAAVSAITELLAPEGRLFVATPNAASLVRRLTRRRWINWHVPYHQHHFTARSLQETIRACGMETETLRTATPAVWIVMQIRALLGRPTPGRATNAWSTVRPVGRRGVLARTIVLVALLGGAVIAHLLDTFHVGESILLVARKPE